MAAPQARPNEPAARTAGAPVRFSIGAGSLDVVLAEFARLTGLKTVLAMPELAMIQSPGVSGLLTPAEAMTGLLMGTSLQATFEGATVTVNVDRVREFVEVAGTARTVSSPRYTAPVRDVPQTIAVIPRATIEEQGATTLSDALRNVPGITLQAGEGGGASNTAGDMFNMRGFNASNSLFVDGVRDDGLISRDVFNLEQIEVFMGPTGSDVGRGTAAGYINMQSKTPHLGQAYSATVGYGNNDRARMTADANFAPPMTADGGWWSKAAFRVNALWQDGGVPGRDVVENETRAVAPTLGFGLGTRTRLTLSGAVRPSGQPARLRDSRRRLGGGAARADDDPGRRPGAADQLLRQPPLRLRQGLAGQRARCALEHDVNRTLSLRYQSRYNRTTREAILSTIQNPAAFDATTNLVTIGRQGNERRNEVTSHQFSLIDRFSTGGLRHAVSAGADVNLENQFAPGLTGLGTRAPVDIYHPNPLDPVLGYAPTRSLAWSRGETATVGLFAFDTVDLGSRWQLSGGARVERYDTDFTNVDAAGVTTANLEGADTLVSGKAGVVFRASRKRQSLRVVRHGGDAAGHGQFHAERASQQPEQPEREAAGVGQFRGRQQVGLLRHPSLGDRRGLPDGERERHLHRGCDGDSADLQPGRPAAREGRDRRCGGAGDGSLAGARQRRLSRRDARHPERRQQRQPVGADAEVLGQRLVDLPAAPRTSRVGGGLRFTDDVFINAANTIKSPGYTLLDGLVEYAVNSHFSLRLNLYNLTDELYIRNVNNNGGRYNPGHPRSAMLSSNVRF